MERAKESSGSMKARRIATAMAAVTLFGMGTAAVMADGTFDGGGAVGESGSGYEAYEYASGPAYQEYDGAAYVYGIGTDGTASYVTYDGEWSDYYTWEAQPEAYKWQAAPAVYGDAQYTVATGESGKYYVSSYDGSAWSSWEDVSGEYTFDSAPYTNVYNDCLFVYGVASDGNLYSKYYDGGAWTEWAPVNDEYAAGAYQPYAVEWGGYTNVFWTGSDGVAYWNRYDGEAWTGAKALPYADAEYAYEASTYAIGYAEDEKLYAYANAADGTPTYSTFTQDDGWSGWAPYGEDIGAKATYQPAAIEYDGQQHVVVTGDDGHAYYTSYDGEAYGEWVDLGENYAYDPAVYVYDGAPILNYTGENGYLYYKEYLDSASGY